MDTTVSKVKPLTIDLVLYLILSLIDQNRSITEIQDELAKKHGTVFRSAGSIHRRMRKLEKAGLITAPPKAKMARSRELTEAGKRVLNELNPKPEVAPKAEPQPAGDAGSDSGQVPEGTELPTTEPGPSANATPDSGAEQSPETVS